MVCLLLLKPAEAARRDTWTVKGLEAGQTRGALRGNRLALRGQELGVFLI